MFEVDMEPAVDSDLVEVSWDHTIKVLQDIQVCKLYFPILLTKSHFCTTIIFQILRHRSVSHFVRQWNGDMVISLSPCWIVR